MSPRAVFEENLTLIDRILASICARNGMYGADAEDFSSWARLRLIENDYAVIAKFQARARLSTYLNTVLHNLFRDYRIHKWGKWRPSAAAKRMGSDAVLLETLTVRDGHEVETAIRMMRENAGVDRTALELEQMLAKFPRRTQRRDVGSDELERIGHLDGTESLVKDAEKEAIARGAEKALSAGVEELEPEDRLILKLRFENGWTVARIARAMHLEQKPLYRRVNAMLSHLRERLESSGVAAEELERIVAWPGLTLAIDLGDGENEKAVRLTRKDGV